MCPAPSSSHPCTDSVRVLVPRENRRSAVRYTLRAEVIVSWTGQGGIAEECRGYTRDISPGGAYVFTTSLPPLGQPVRMSIRLPMFDGEVSVPCVAVKGRVLRVDEDRDRCVASGFSVCNEKVTLCAT
ncbi:MAG: PilZ domain-containing protein [Candidatus Acidiferrales bacterium]